jgi:hypothetical protein
MFQFGNSELPINTFLVDLDSYLLSKTTRFAQRELLRWINYQLHMDKSILELSALTLEKLT